MPVQSGYRKTLRKSVTPESNASLYEYPESLSAWSEELGKDAGKVGSFIFVVLEGS